MPGKKQIKKTDGLMFSASRLVLARGTMRQEELAGAAGVGITTMRNYENKITEPKATTLMRIAAATGNPLSFFFTPRGV